MRRIIIRLLVLLLMILCPWTLPKLEGAEEAVAKIQPPQAPPYREGQFWRFRLSERGGDPLDYDSSRLPGGVYEIVYLQNRLTAFYLRPDQEKEEVDPDHPTLAQLLGRDRDVEFPLAAGRNWTYTYTQRISRPLGTPGFRFIRHTVRVNVSEAENVTTRAGIFKALKLVKDDKGDTTWRRDETTLYFSEETRSVVKMSGAVGGGRRRDVELIGYGVASPIGPVEAKPGEERLARTDLVASPEGKTVPVAPSFPLTQSQINEPQKMTGPSEPLISTESTPMLPPAADRLELFIDNQETSAYVDHRVDQQPTLSTEKVLSPLPAKSQTSVSPNVANQEIALLTKPAAPVGPGAFQLKLNIIGQRKEGDGNYIELFVNEGSVLRSRDNFQVHLESSRPAYVYVLIYDSEGKASQLFPDPKIEETGFVQAGQSLAVPGPDSWFWLDDSTGTETIYVLASENPMTDIRGLVAKMETADDAGQKRASQEIKQRIAVMQRGIGGVTKGLAVTYTLSDGKKIQKVTEVVTGTGSVVRAVSFQHR